ncbi:MAG TPA: hypothetical protein VGB70_09135 [Allosphingosinicella sp.]|jgi:putative transposase
MTYMRLTAGAFLDYLGNRLRFERRQDHNTEWRSTTTLQHFLFTDTEIQRGIAKGEIKLYGNGAPVEVRAASKIHGQRRASKEDEIEAERKLHYVLAAHRRGILNPKATPKDWQATVDEVWEDVGRTWKRIRGVRKGDIAKKPSVKSVRRWVAAGGPHPTLKKLISRHRHKGNYTDRIAAVIRQIIADCIDEHYLNRPPINIYALQDIIHGRVREHNAGLRSGEKPEPLPGLTAIETSIRELPQDEVLRSRHGDMAAFIKYGSAEAQAAPKAPLDRVELDSTPADLIVVDWKTLLPIGRPHIVVAIDKCTRMILGWFVTFEKPSIQALLQCLRNAMLAKDYVAEMNKKHGWNIRHECETFGVPEHLILDRGLENISEQVAHFAVRAGINQVIILGGKKPWLKGLIESSLKTVSERLLHPAPGTTFHNTLKRLGYNAEKDAVCTLDDLDYALNKFFIDVYPRLPARTLNNRRRIDVWRELTRKTPVDSVEDVTNIDHLFGRTERAKVGRYGINHLSMQYYSRELIQCLSNSRFQKALAKDGGKVEFFLDPADIGQIHVRLPHIEETIHVSVASKWRPYATGLSLWHHRTVRAYALAQARDANDTDELLKCKLELMEILRGATTGKRGSIRAGQTLARMEGEGRRARSGKSAATKVESNIPAAPALSSDPYLSNDIGSPSVFSFARSEAAEPELPIGAQPRQRKGYRA